MGSADGASGSSSQPGNGLWIIGGSTPPGSPQSCWWSSVMVGRNPDTAQDRVFPDATRQAYRVKGPRCQSRLMRLEEPKRKSVPWSFPMQGNNWKP